MSFQASFQTWKDGVTARIGRSCVPRLFFAVLRRWAPVFSFGNRVIVSRNTDVVEVLTRDEDFTIAEINAVKTIRDDGLFVLCMDRSAQHDREKALLNQVVSRDDLGRIEAFAAKQARGLIEDARPAGRIDMVNGYARVAAVRLVADYFGIPGPDELTMMRWLRSLFHDLFLNLSNNADVQRAAVNSYAELKSYMDALIRQRKGDLAAGEPPPPCDSLLTRLLALQSIAEYGWLDEDTIRRNLGGVIIGAVDTTSKAAVHVMDELLRRPDVFKEARAAAMADDRAALWAIALEALRFNPHSPIIIRYAKSQTVINAAGGHPRTVAAGRTVYATTLSAVFDPSVFPDPNRFIAGRDAAYMHFGYGLHECQGRYINSVQIPALLAALLRLKNLRRAPGADGQVVYAGPFPDRLILQFDS